MTIDKIIKKYRELKAKDFKDRIKGFEEFHDPDNIERAQMDMHAEYVVFGKPSDREKFPGAYDAAYKVLDKAVKEDKDKVEDLDTITSILETYVDEFLTRVMGDKFNDYLKHAKKEGLDAKQLRKAKSALFSQFAPMKVQGEDGKWVHIDILDENYIRSNLKGKKKIEVVKHLKNIAEVTQQTYTNHLYDDIWDDMFGLEDHLHLAKYVKPRFDKAGVTHENHPLTRSTDDLVDHYKMLITGKTKDLMEKGYKVHAIKHEEKEE